MKKIFFFDVDGTILPAHENSKLSDKIIYALQSLEKNGHLVYICTGKAVDMIQDVLKETKLTNYITSNGQRITKGNKLLHHIPLKNQDVQNWIDLSRKLDLTLSLQTDKHNYAIEGPNCLERLTEALVPVSIAIPPLKHELDQTQVVYQLGVYGDNQTIENIDYPGYKILKWGAHAYDAIPNEVSKARGISWLLANLGDEFESYAFGDGLNDLEMLQLVDYGIAVDNACPELKAVADVIIESVENDGIYKYLVEEKLIEEM
ncbi:MAG: HAD family hydrolase [Mycoplasmatales bacterium]